MSAPGCEFRAGMAGMANRIKMLEGQLQSLARQLGVWQAAIESHKRLGCLVKDCKVCMVKGAIESARRAQAAEQNGIVKP